MNRTILLIAIVAVLAFASIALFRTAEQTSVVEMKLPALKAMEYFSDTTRMNQWMVPFAGSDASFNNSRMVKGSDTLTLLKLSAFDVAFRRSNPAGNFDFNISVVPDKDSVNESYFVLHYNTQKWKSLFRSNRLAEDAKASLDSLKGYLGNPDKLYGYHIQGALVEDTSFLFASKKIQRSRFAEETKALYEMLIDEAGKRNAGYNGVRIFHFQDGPDSTRTIYAGIGVTKRVDTKDGDKVSYKMMPYQLNLLVVDFYGPYHEVPNIYNALEKYRVDNRYVSMAIPFHKYMDTGYGFAENKLVRLRVCYPVF